MAKKAARQLTSNQLRDAILEFLATPQLGQLPPTLGKITDPLSALNAGYIYGRTASDSPWGGGWTGGGFTTDDVMRPEAGHAGFGTNPSIFNPAPPVPPPAPTPEAAPTAAPAPAPTPNPEGTPAAFLSPWWLRFMIDPRRRGL